jgi:peptide/nickel transport system permease protein
MHAKAKEQSDSWVLKFIKNPLGLLSFILLLLATFLALFAYVLAPDDSPNANNMHLSIAAKPPGFKVLMCVVPNLKAPEVSQWAAFLYGKPKGVLELPITQYKEVANGVEVTLLQATADGTQKRFYAFNELVPPGEKFQLDQVIKPYKFWLGTDKYGRDLLSRMLIGLRVSLSVGFIAVLISLLIGISLGAISGYFGGRTDQIIMWLINVTWSIPTLLLVIAITLALGKGFWQVFIAVGLTMWVEVARVVRGQVMSVKQRQYITAARALGYSDLRIIWRHILPNALTPLIIISAANFASAILIESGLSFLGIGAQPPIPSWGSIIKDHYAYIVLGKPYLALVPGFAIMILVMAFMLLGNTLRDVLDVKQ